MAEKRVQFQNIVENQLPTYVQTEFPLVSDFLKSYYVSQEFQGAPVDLIQNIDDYTKVEGKYCSAVVHSTAEDCRFTNLSVGSRILVDRVMIEEVEHDGKKHHLILDNYVIAQITE